MKISSRSFNYHFGEPRRIMTDKINHVADAVKIIERKILPADTFRSFWSAEKIKFNVKGVPRDGIYVPTNIRGTVEVLDNIYTSGHLPEEEIDAAVLGSGLGAFTMPFSIYCEYLNLSRYFVTGFEFNRHLADASRTIAKRLEIRNVGYINKDFTQLVREDFKQFNFIYIFKPFEIAFVDVMDDVYPRINPGTLLLTRHCPREGALRSGQFKLLYKPLEEFYGNEYHLYQRTNSEILLH
jgi:hypothetical protein